MSIQINSNGKINRVTTAYTVDRLFGTTKGFAGPRGIIYTLGEEPSPFSYLPAAVVVKRFFGRNRKPIVSKAVKSPLPLPVLKSIAVKILESDLGIY